MGRIEKAAGFVGILVALEGLYDAYVTRKRNKAVSDKEEEIKELKRKLAKFEEKEKDKK